MPKAIVRISGIQTIFRTRMFKPISLTQTVLYNRRNFLYKNGLFQPFGFRIICQDFGLSNQLVPNTNSDFGIPRMPKSGCSGARYSDREVGSLLSEIQTKVNQMLAQTIICIFLFHIKWPTLVGSDFRQLGPYQCFTVWY